MRRHNGFSLIEVVISGALVATTVGALFAAASMAVRLSSSGQQRLIASQLSREGIEIVRQIRDTNFIANPCTLGTECKRTWSDGILEPNEALPLTQVIFKQVNQTNGQSKLQTVLPTDDALCTNYFGRDTLPGSSAGLTAISSAVPTLNVEIYCRRIIIEPLTTTELQSQAIRVRSQVAWLADSKRVFRTLSQVFASPECVGSGATADTLATEWCTEQVTILTNWRTSL